MKILRRFVRPLQDILSAYSTPLLLAAERQLVLQAQVSARANRALSRLDGLCAAEFSAFSQFGEDGILDWLVERVPGIPRSFVEFGVQDYREANTRLLLQLRNWRGLVLDGSATNIAAIKKQDVFWRHELYAVEAFVDRDNINFLIESAGFSDEIGILSIDVDGNDYWIWDAINVVSPAIVICEYNAILGDRHALTTPYDRAFQRSVAHHSNLYFGASLRALSYLAERKGYSFVGTTSTGCNAFFVRNDVAANVLSSLDAVVAFPSAVREARDALGQLTFAAGAARKVIIADMPFVNPETLLETTLAACEPVYSDAWAAGDSVKWP